MKSAEQRKDEIRLVLRPIVAGEESLVLEIFNQSKTYFRKVDGCDPSLKIVLDAIAGGPQKKSESYKKEFLIVEHSDRPVGVIDAHIDHPQKGIVYVGLLLIEESFFGVGIGRRVYNLFEDYVRRAHGAKSLRLGVSAENDVTAFWEKMGFQPNGRTYSWQGESKTTEVRELSKELAPL